MLDDDKVHTTPRMKEVVKFFRHVIVLLDQGMQGEGFLGTIQLIIPEEFTGAKVKWPDTGDDGDEGIRVGVLVARTGHKEAAFYVGDGQGRLVGLHSSERDPEGRIAKFEREVRKRAKRGEDTTATLEDFEREKAFRKKIDRVLTKNDLGFICYASRIESDGTLAGLDTDAQKRLYVEGNALNSVASPLRRRRSSSRASPWSSGG